MKALKTHVVLTVSTLLLSSQMVWAAEDTANLTVTALVVSNCTVANTALAFPNYDSTLATDTDGSSAVGITVTCLGSSNYEIALNRGANASGDTRRMANGGTFLEYELYTSDARDTVWGDGTTFGSIVSGSMGVAGANSHIVYGRIPALQSPTTGTYTDTVLITVTY